MMQEIACLATKTCWGSSITSGLGFLETSILFLSGFLKKDFFCICVCGGGGGRGFLFSFLFYLIFLIEVKYCVMFEASFEALTVM